MVKCRKCKVELTRDNWYPSRRKGYNKLCKKCCVEEQRNYRLKYPTKWRVYVQRAYLKLKMKVFTHYSTNPPKCANCEFSNILALEIDHIHGGGNKHRRQIGCSSGGKFYSWLIKNNYPKGYQDLCANCNRIKRKHDKCGYEGEEK